MKIRLRSVEGQVEVRSVRSGQVKVMVRPGSRSKHFVDAVKVETNTMIYVLLDTEILIKQQRKFIYCC